MRSITEECNAPVNPVLDGVTIGRDAVVGANAVVTTDLPERVVAAGIPARVIRTRGEGGDTGGAVYSIHKGRKGSAITNTELQRKRKPPRY